MILGQIYFYVMAALSIAGALGTVFAKQSDPRGDERSCF